MGLISTSEAKCKDCYKCIRHCPVKAIGINNEQAWVVEETCILCGNCLEACPQNAKSIESKIHKLDEFLKSNQKVIVSLAPSYLSGLDYSSPWKIISGLKELGIERIEETAVAAEIIGTKYKELYKSNIEQKKHHTVISSCCPTIVNLIKKHYPKLVNMLAPVVSPMLAHAQMIKKRCKEDVKVVFIGPCISKKEEADRDNRQYVDLILTFEEVREYLESKKIKVEKIEDMYPDLVSHKARNYPLEKGILETTKIDNNLDTEVLSVSGIDETMELFDEIEKGEINPDFIEALACRGGCIGGPAIGNNISLFIKKNQIAEYSGVYQEKTEESPDETNYLEIDLRERYNPENLEEQIPTEEEIREILAKIGKKSPKDETNCGGCGYSSCREKAIAVYKGLAEPEMCIPYMREKAESLSHAVVDSTLNAIIIVDKEMIIQEFNPAATEMFNRKNVDPKGKHLSQFVDPHDYEKVWNNQEMIVDKYKKYEQYDLITRENIYPLPKYGVVIAVITDVTSEEKRKREIDEMRKEGLDRASRVIKKHMEVSQKIASLLGESTAETKATLNELMEIMEKKEANINES